MPPKGSKKKKNFSSAEIRTLLNEVASRKDVLFARVSDGVTGLEKQKAWQEITGSVNVVCAEERTLREIKKKWFDLKMEAKKRLTAARRVTAAGGRDTVRPTDMDERIGAIIGEFCPTGVESDYQLDTELLQPEDIKPEPYCIPLELDIAENNSKYKV